MSASAGLFASAGVRRAMAGLALLLVAALLTAFLWLPRVQPDFIQGGLWDSICRVAGVPSRWSKPLERDDPQASRVAAVFTGALADGGDVGHGGTLALRCTMCHGARGVSASDVPNLAGQYAEVTFKQLVDYKNGQRHHTLMQALAAGLSDQDIRDLSAFYAQLPRPSPAEPPTKVPRLVTVGDPMRNIAPCASCHGGIDKKPGSPWLEGMPHAYVVTQLRQFARGTRRNDALEAMRNIARPMKDDEMDEVARYYATRAIIGHEGAPAAPAR
jgi:cytochrome c553